MDENAQGDTPKSEPLQAFEKNLDGLGYLIELYQNDLRAESDAIKTANEAVAQISEIVSGNYSGAIQEQFAPLLATLQKSTESITRWLKGRAFLNEWMLVMLVSFVEAYLEDVLILLGQRKPELMDKVKIRVSHSELLSATSPVSELIDRMSHQWAKDLLRSGKPERWIHQLEAYGATGYRKGLGRDMTRIWERRHTIVHSPGTYEMGVSELRRTTSITWEFVKPTDRLIVSPQVPASVSDPGPTPITT